MEIKWPMLRAAVVVVRLLLVIAVLAGTAASSGLLAKIEDEQFQPIITKPSKHQKKHDYEYILPQRKVTSCPSFASFKFACESNHLMSIDSVVFAPVLGTGSGTGKGNGESTSSLSSSSMVPGECESDWRAECTDESGAFEYAARECSSREHCSLISYQLRSRTKCAQHQVVSIFYKCIPSWEITNVPIKCDICKNVTVNSIRDNFGFIHSAWYPKLYPRVTCHSLIQSRPDHFIVVYSVSGSIGLDRILIESVDNGALPMREILTGNLTTRLVITSANDVNITVLTEDTYYFEQRRFLLYFYIVPKCYIILCSNVTGYPQVGYYPATTRPAAFYVTSAPPPSPSPLYTYTPSYYSSPPAASSSYLPQPPPPAPPPPPPPPALPQSQITYAPPLLAEYTGKHHHNKISDAWLAAILALIYALLMVFAVLVAIYCRRRRRRRLVQENNIHIFSPSCVSSSHMLANPTSMSTSMTRSSHSVSIRGLNGPACVEQHSIPSGYLTTSASASCSGLGGLCGGVGGGGGGDNNNMIYSQVNNTKRLCVDDLDTMSCHYGGPTTAAASLPTFQRQLNANTSTEFDNYSQVLSDDYDEDEAAMANYGDIDVTSYHNPYQQQQQYYQGGGSSRYQNIVESGSSLPYSLKTNTQHGSIVAASSNAAANVNAAAATCSATVPAHVYSNSSQQFNTDHKNMYRAVEYKKGPQMETVRVHNTSSCHDNDCFDTSMCGGGGGGGDQLMDEIHTTTLTTTTTTTRYEEYLGDPASAAAAGMASTPAKVTTTESVTYRRDVNGDLIEETTTTTTAAASPNGDDDDDERNATAAVVANNCPQAIGGANNNNRSSSFLVKLYPSDEQEKEVQEMTMYVESPNATVAHSTNYRHF